MKKYFLVEQNQIIRTYFEKAFPDRVYVLDSFEDYLFRMPDFGPDLIILGASLAIEEWEKEQSQYKADMVNSEIPVVVFGNEEEKSRLTELGFSGNYLEKPVQHSNLEARLNEFLS